MENETNETVDMMMGLLKEGQQNISITGSMSTGKTNLLDLVAGNKKGDDEK